MKNIDKNTNRKPDVECLNRDFDILKENRRARDANLTLDDYIEFVTQFYRFANHPKRAVRVIEGDNFRP